MAKNTKKCEAKDSPSRGQGQEGSRPRTQAQVFSKKSSKFFFKRSPKKEYKKRSFQILGKVSGVFQHNFKGSKNSAVLEPRVGQFSRT